MTQNIKKGLIVGTPSQQSVCYPDSVVLDRVLYSPGCGRLWRLQPLHSSTFDVKTFPFKGTDA